MEDHDKKVDSLLREALGKRAGKPNFEDWKASHRSALAHLNPVVTELYQNRFRTILRIASSALAACLLLAFGVFMAVTNEQSFANVLEPIRKAERLSWVVTTYLRCVGEDPEYTWLISFNSKYEFEMPGLLRETRYDESGEVIGIEIVDSLRNKSVALDPRNKTFVPQADLPNRVELPPLTSIRKALASDSLQFVGRREVEDNSASVFRHERDDMLQVMDIWVSTDTKHLLGASVPGADQFDPETASDRDNVPLEKFRRATIVGTLWSNIEINPELRPDTFSLLAPEGYRPVQPSIPEVYTEEELVAFLGVACRANGDVFPGSLSEIEFELYQRIETKPKNERTQPESDFRRLWYQNFVNGNTRAVSRFAEIRAAPNSFRYIGKGAKLRESDRVVCFYRARDGVSYRAVFGDLTIRDVSPDSLPLPIDPEQ